MEVQPITESRRLRSAKVLCGIDASAFVAILLALLFMFMADGLPMLIGASRWTSPGPTIPKPCRVRSGRTYHRGCSARRQSFFGHKARNTAEDLTAEIRERPKGGGERTVYIKADARARYRALAEVVDAVHEAGVERVGLLTEQRRELPL